MLKEPLSKSPLPAKDLEISEIDFSQGEFWQMPLGQAVRRNFIETEVIDKGISFPLTTAQTANLLKLRLEGRSSYFIAGLGKAGLFARVERDAERHYVLKLEHIVIAGLALLYLEKGYSLGQIREELSSLLGGTSLSDFIGGLESEYYTYRRRNIFAEDSPWLQFPLESIQVKSASINSSKQKSDDKLEEDPKDKWVPQDKRLLIIPKISSELILYNKEKIKSLLNDFNNIPDDADARDHLPLLMIQNIMFILAAHEQRLSEYDKEKESYTIFETRAGIKACFEEWKNLEQEQEITNLFHLFQLVEWKVRKNADMYWSSAKTVVE